MYAIQLFRCIDFVPFIFLQGTQKSNVCEEVQQDKDVYQKEQTIEELCPHVHNSIKEILLMLCHCISPSGLSCGSPWMFVMSLINSWRPLWMYRYSGVCDLSRKISSIIVPRCLTSNSLMLLENCSLKSCSEDGVKELILNGPGIGRGLASCPSSSSWLSDSSRRGGLSLSSTCWDDSR